MEQPRRHADPSGTKFATKAIAASALTGLVLGALPCSAMPYEPWGYILRADPEPSLPLLAQLQAWADQADAKQPDCGQIPPLAAPADDR